MHIIKYDKNFTRRYFMESAGKGALGAGMLAPLWDVIARDGDISKAYPDEALDIAHYTDGKINVGDTLDADNVHHVRDMLDPGMYLQISQQGRLVDIAPPETDINMLSPADFNEATLRNKGKAMFDSIGNVVTKDGKPWIGGRPFPEPKNAREIVADNTLAWSGYDSTFYPIEEWDMDGRGNQKFHYQLLFSEYKATTRIKLDPKPYMPGHEDKLRFAMVLFTAPSDIKGTSLVNHWHYDQRKLPEFFGWLPQFKRIRRFPTNQRFEPMIPGSTVFPSDAFMTGDPYLTWGNFKTVAKIPFLGGVSRQNWSSEKDRWLHDRCGGTTGKKFFRTSLSLMPEVYAVDLYPTGYPRAPYGKKRIWFDARNVSGFAMVGFDRNGETWKVLEGGGGPYDAGNGNIFPDDSGNPYVSWTYFHSHDVQSDLISTIQQTAEIDGGYKVRINDPSVYEKFCTVAAIRRLGT
jgi:hypothetical protein